MKDYKAIDKMFRVCSSCGGYGHTFTHYVGAFGEVDATPGPRCEDCEGFGFYVRRKYVKKIKERLNI